MPQTTYQLMKPLRYFYDIRWYPLVMLY